jgi:thiol-disulfide isomerase/thioredoxin
MLALLLLLSAPAPTPAPAPEVKVNVLSQVGDVRRVLSEHKGKVILVKFWATWCDSCVEQFPDFIRTAKKLPSACVDVMTMSVDVKQAIDLEVLPFLKKQQATFPAYLVDIDDPGLMMASIDKTWEGTLPATFVFGRDGTLKKRFIGPTPKLEETVVALCKS